MNLLILFWLNSDNFVAVIPDPGEEKRQDAIQAYASSHGYTPFSLIAIEYYMEIP